MSDEFENEFYRVERSLIREIRWSAWCGVVRIIRKDNDDIVYERGLRGRKNAEEVKFDLDNWLREKFKNLSKPLDWGLDPLISSVIKRFLVIKREAYGFVLEAEKASSPEEARDLYAKGDSYEQGELEKLKHEIEQLSEAQKVELIAPTLEQINDPLRLEFEDILMAKSSLYFLMGEPVGALEEASKKLSKVFQDGSKLFRELHPELKELLDKEED